MAEQGEENEHEGVEVSESGVKEEGVDPQEQPPTFDPDSAALEEFNRPEFLAHHPIPIIVENLSVRKDKTGKAEAAGGSEALEMAPNFATALLGRWLASHLGMGGPKPVITDAAKPSSMFVFENVSCLLLPQEITLVLGPSSSGKTTLMSTISDLIRSSPNLKTLDIEGTVLLGDLDPTSSTKNLSRATAFVDQGDLSLTPILTVEETVRFARLCAEGQHDYTEESMKTILQLAGLDHVAKTVVGDADIRGVSGGQKRRVKVLETAVGKDCIAMFLDEMTNGLDAASALSLTKVCRIASKATKSTSMASLLQPSNEVFEQFQRLILLTPDGKVAYSGKRENVVAHFESLGLQKPAPMNVPEFLLKCIYAPQEFAASDNPTKLETSEDWAVAFRESQAGQELQEEIAKVKQHCQETKASSKLPDLEDWAVPTSTQVRLLAGRGWKLVLRNPSSVGRIIMAAFFGLFIGTLFLNTPDDADGTSTRTGFILTMLFMGFLNSSLAPLEDLFKDRNTFYIHRRANFYKTASYYLGQIVTSTPIPLIEAFLLSIIAFFLVGMNNHRGWGFLYFWAQFSLVSLCGNAISRNLAYCLPTQDVANTLGSAVLLVITLTTGQSPQYLQLPVWLRWISWLSPSAYCYEGMVVNEVLDRTLNATVTGGGVADPANEWAQQYLGIPRIPYDQAPAGMNTEEMLMLFDLYMLLALTIVFEFMGCAALHHSQKWYGPASKRYQVAAGMSLATPPLWISHPGLKNPKDKGSYSAVASSEKAFQTSVPPAPPAQLTAFGIVYEVDIEISEEEATAAAKEKSKKLTATEGEKPSSVFSFDQEEAYDTPMTVAQYGQAGKGQMQERLLRRRLGDDAVNLSKRNCELSKSSIRVELPTVIPGRLRLLSGITASFEPGTMTALMGSSGAGKTTLLDVLAGYKTGGHIMGDICINGVPKTDETWKTIAAYCEQVDLHSPTMTVRESLVFAARLRLRPSTLPDAEKVSFAMNVLSLLELEEYADMLVGDESAGEGLPKHARKRLTVGVEMSANPSILFADEPTSGLDSLSASVVVSCLERAAKQEGLTIVCTIHQPSRGVFEAFDNLLLLRKGGVCVYNGKVSELDTYMRSASPDGEKYAMPLGLNPADHTLDIFCGPGGEGVDWSDLYERSEMARAAKKAHEEDAAKRGAITADTTPQSFTSEVFIEIQRETLMFWRTPSYMAIRFVWTVVANIIVAVIYRGAEGANVVGSMFFWTNIATVPLLSAVVPLVKGRAIFYREIASGTYRRLSYGIAVHVAEIPFNFGCALASFLIFYFLVGLSLDDDRPGYFMVMAFAVYWMFPAMGQFLAFISPNIGTATALGSLLLTLCTLTMGFLIAPSDIPPWYIWIYWINPLRYIQQGLTINQMGGTDEGDLMLEALGWSSDQKWWYCYVVVIFFGIAFTVGTIAATRISWLQR